MIRTLGEIVKHTTNIKYGKLSNYFTSHRFVTFFEWVYEKCAGLVYNTWIGQVEILGQAVLSLIMRNYLVFSHICKYY